MGKVKAWYMRTLDDAYEASLGQPQQDQEQQDQQQAQPQQDPWHLWDNDDVGDNLVNFDKLMDRWEDV